MRGFKSAVTMQARILNIPFDWQARYHDRVIRDDEEFRKIANSKNSFIFVQSIKQY